MEDATIIDFTGRDAVTDPLTDLLRKGARELLQAAVEAERDTFLAAFSERRTADGRAAVVGSGYHPERAVQTGIGPVTVKVPKVRAKDGKPVTFRSALVPPYVRKTKSIAAALPWLYLKGISTGEMGAALKMLLGPEAHGFSAKTISRLKGEWAAEYDDWRKADLSRDEWVVRPWARTMAPSRAHSGPTEFTAGSAERMTGFVSLSSLGLTHEERNIFWPSKTVFAKARKVGARCFCP